MNELRLYNTSELEEEIERRKRAEKIKPKPVQLKNPDWDKVLDRCMWYIDHCHIHGCEPKDAEYWIYSATITAVYGDEIWHWINDKVR
jgi:hypothetical protein